MCVAFLAHDAVPGYRLIIAANRDEYYARPTTPMHFWPGHPILLAGRDEQAGGTWLGVTESGRLALVTNVRIPNNGAPRSRGSLVRDFLVGEEPAEVYAQTLTETGEEYEGYNLIFGTAEELWWTSNRSPSPPKKLGAGIFGVSNAFLNTPWPKVVHGKQGLAHILANPEWRVEMLFDMLADSSRAPDSELPDTGIGLDLERVLSPIFIQTERYGTRSSTVLIVDAANHIRVWERSFEGPGRDFVERDYHIPPPR